jgi:hypothetical protein
MKKINLQVNVKYTVNFDCEVSDEVFNSLEYMQDKYPFGMDEDDCISSDASSSTAFEWLSKQCEEGDAMSISFEIEDLTEL